MSSYRLAVDIGGTFTDVVLQTDLRCVETAKTSTTPDDPVAGAMTGIKEVLGHAGIELRDVALLVHGTTLATNTLIEKKGARVGAILTEGFRDILEIGYERRYDQEDLLLEKPDLLVPRERCLTVGERVGADGDVLQSLDERSVHRTLTEFDRLGVESAAVCLLHAYANSGHEQRIAEIIGRERPGWSVSLSSGVSPEVREFDRLCATVANAYVKPSIASYLQRFEGGLGERGFKGAMLVMTSAGGMTTVEAAKRYPIRLVESGPSGGAILAARVAERCGLDRVVSFDMGGTTAKFCMIDDFKPLTSRSFEAARAERFTKGSGIPIRVPTIEMIEIGAGGGSVAVVDELDRIAVGPESMGAEPGPACFARGGDAATVTDADLVLGHIGASRFADGALVIDESAAQGAVMRAVGDRLNLDLTDAAHGISQMVSENMANAGRVHAAERGAALAGRTMIAFGGNGPLHATRVAEKMGVSKIVIPVDPGVGSAVGFLSAPISFEIVSSHYTTLDRFDFAGVNALFDRLAGEAREVVQLPDDAVIEARAAHMRYAGQGHEIQVPLPVRHLEPSDMPALTGAYDKEYQSQFGRTVPGMRIEILNWAVRIESIVEHVEIAPTEDARRQARPVTTAMIYFGSRFGHLDTSVYHREKLCPGDTVQGPALIVESHTTTLLEPRFHALVDGVGNIVVERVTEPSRGRTNLAAESEIDLQLMWNRLLAVVEEQAQALIRSAFSPIVRECGDISAGVFDTQGRMLAQALTGTPGHINTMASGVANVLDACPPSRMRPGDVYATNDPWLAAGHLNDYMLVRPVFQGEKLVGYSACTSHLVDVGGKCMGPEGSDVFDEGLRLPVSCLVKQGRVDRQLLRIIKANSRHPTETEGDLYALVACCDVGASRLLGMMEEYELRSLDALAQHIIERSRRATAAAIRAFPQGEFEHAISLDGYEFEIDLNAKITIGDGEVTIDFAGSSPCSRFGINVPINYAAAYSVFALRCAMAKGIPNNAGSLAPFRVRAPEACIVNALDPAPVAMRHTIGQLLPDLIFGCLHQAAPGCVPAEGASCMYDLPMRNIPATDRSRFAIELVHNGGTGARPGKDGLSATAFPSGVWGSQVEVTECTVPVRLRRRELRKDSGGAGRHRGGLGQSIEIESSEDTDFLLFLSLDRVRHPARGRAEGLCGATGRVELSSGQALPGRGEAVIPKGERLLFSTPGGGGYGNPRVRNALAVWEDVSGGLVSVEAARCQYGVVVDASNQLDREATRRLRGKESC